MRMVLSRMCDIPGWVKCEVSVSRTGGISRTPIARGQLSDAKVRWGDVSPFVESNK